MNAVAQPLSTRHAGAHADRPAWRGRVAHLPKEPVINLLAFMTACALGLVQLGIIFHARETLHASPAVIGWLAAVWLPGYVAGCLLIEPRLRHLPPRLPVLWSTVSMGLVFWWMSATGSMPLLMVLSTLYGVLLSLFWPFLMGWLSLGHEGEKLGRTMATYNLSWCSANVVSPFLCGWLSERDTLWPLWGGGALSLGSALILWMAARHLPHIRTLAHLPVAPDSGALEPAGRRTRLRFAAWTGLVAMCFGIGVVLAVFPVAARQDLGFSMFLVGNLLLVRSAIQAVAFIAMGKTGRWHFRAAPMLAGQCLGMAGFLGLLFATGRTGIALSLAACGGAAAVSFVYSMFHGVSGHHQRSQAMAIHEVLLATGLGLGGIIGGMLYQAAGMRLVYALCVAGFLIALPVQAAIARWARKTEIPDA